MVAPLLPPPPQLQGTRYIRIHQNIYRLDTSAKWHIHRFQPRRFPLEIKTDSTLQSYKLMRVRFYASQDHEAGGVEILLKPSPGYYLHNCHKIGSSWTPFPTDLRPTDNDKVWRITLTKTSGIRLVIHCNDKEVVNVLMSDTECSVSQWNNYWSKERKKIKFFNTLSAFGQYFSPGNIRSTKLT